MNNPETIIIPRGVMINLSNHEDDEPLIATEDLEAVVIGPKAHGGIPVSIPAIDPDRTFYFHQPEEKS